MLLSILFIYFKMVYPLACKGYATNNKTIQEYISEHFQFNRCSFLVMGSRLMIKIMGDKIHILKFIDL